MATIIDNLRKLSASHRARIERAKEIADKMIRNAEAAKKAARPPQDGKG